MVLPKQYEWIRKEEGPKMIIEALKEFGTIENPGTANNAKIISWAEEVGKPVANVYKADSIPWCFGAGTLIDTEKGLHNIEELNIGDKVLSHDGKFHKISNILIREKETFKLKPLGILDTIVTEEHPYLVKKRIFNDNNTSDKEWVKVKDIKKGDFIATPLFSENQKVFMLDINDNIRDQYFEDDKYLWVPIKSIEPTGIIETVYDLTVEDSHSFIANGAIVHNCGLFMAVVAKRAGKIIPKDPLWALNWGNFGHHMDSAEFGDILVFVRKTSTGSTAGHVALYVGEDDTTYHCLGGNQQDKVCFTRMAKNRLYTIRRPDYNIQPAQVRKIVLSATGKLSNNEQ